MLIQITKTNEYHSDKYDNCKLTKYIVASFLHYYFSFSQLIPLSLLYNKSNEM